MCLNSLVSKSLDDFRTVGSVLEWNQNPAILQESYESRKNPHTLATRGRPEPQFGDLDWRFSLAGYISPLEDHWGMQIARIQPAVICLLIRLNPAALPPAAIEAKRDRRGSNPNRVWHVLRSARLKRRIAKARSHESNGHGNESNKQDPDRRDVSTFCQEVFPSFDDIGSFTPVFFANSFASS